MSFELGQVEERTGAAAHGFHAVVGEEHAGVEQARRHRCSVDQDMAFDEVPAARPDDERRGPLGEPIVLVGRAQLERATDRGAERGLATDMVVERACRAGWSVRTEP